MISKFSDYNRTKLPPDATSTLFSFF